jgi:hypothetical protein
MWQKAMKKVIYILNINNHNPEITAITYPLIEDYAKKIGVSDVHIIKERKFEDWPVTYEKFQIYELAQKYEADWNIYIDSDALIHPDCPDFTLLLDKNTVAHHGADFAPVRWRYDRFFIRDGRHIGSGNWFTIASDLCIELWKPLDDLTPAEALDNIQPTAGESQSGVITPDHLIDDYTCSRNIAKYGLKFVPIRVLVEKFGYPGGGHFFWHKYLIPPEVKVVEMKTVLKEWGVTE